MYKWQTGLLLMVVSLTARGKDIQILNISYDPTRVFYQHYNQAFVKFYNQKKKIMLFYANHMVDRVNKRVPSLMVYPLMF